MTQLAPAGMSFEPSETQAAVAELAREIVTGTVTEEHQLEVEQTGSYDRLLWKRLAESGLLGVGIPEDGGGTGGGMQEVASLLVALGEAAAYVPAFPALVPAAFALARFGGPARAALLASFLGGESIVTWAPPSRFSARPTARRESGGWTLGGEILQVPYWDESAGVLVAADSDEGPLLLYVARELVTEAIRQETTAGETEFDLSLAGVVVDIPDTLVSGDAARAATDWLHDCATVALCAQQVGAAEHVLRMTASYTTSRQQFGRPIATFQAVQQRLADAYIDVDAMRWTMWQAAWAIDSEILADGDVQVAKFWAAEGGQRVMSACLHLHGGMGVDTTYPLHRYYLRSKTWELSLGSSTEQLVSLGARIAAGLPRQYARAGEADRA